MLDSDRESRPREGSTYKAKCVGSKIVLAKAGEKDIYFMLGFR